MLISAADIFHRTGILMEHFDLFSSGNWLIVHKEPRKEIILSTGDVYAGYGYTNANNYTYVPISGIYPCIRVHEEKLDNKLAELNAQSPGSYIKIKVKQDARDFITNGKNQKFELENMTFQETVDETVQNYLGLKFYKFILKKTL
jgi:hypothetical protein